MTLGTLMVFPFLTPVPLHPLPRLVGVDVGLNNTSGSPVPLPWESRIVPETRVSSTEVVRGTVEVRYVVKLTRKLVESGTVPGTLPSTPRTPRDQGDVTGEVVTEGPVTDTIRLP